MASRLSPGRRMKTIPAISEMMPTMALNTRLPGSPAIASMISRTAAINR